MTKEKLAEVVQWKLAQLAGRVMSADEYAAKVAAVKSWARYQSAYVVEERAA
jgi:hypothetical protein